MDASPQNARCGEGQDPACDGTAFTLVGIEQRRAAGSADAKASFQPRFAASWMAVFMPWPVAGE